MFSKFILLGNIVFVWKKYFEELPKVAGKIAKAYTTMCKIRIIYILSEI